MFIWHVSVQPLLKCNKMSRRESANTHRTRLSLTRATDKRFGAAGGRVKCLQWMAVGHCNVIRPSKHSHCTQSHTVISCLYCWGFGGVSLFTSPVYSGEKKVRYKYRVNTPKQRNMDRLENQWGRRWIHSNRNPPHVAVNCADTLQRSYPRCQPLILPLQWPTAQTTRCNWKGRTQCPNLTVTRSTQLDIIITGKISFWSNCYLQKLLQTESLALMFSGSVFPSLELLSLVRVIQTLKKWDWPQNWCLEIYSQQHLFSLNRNSRVNLSVECVVCSLGRHRNALKLMQQKPEILSLSPFCQQHGTGPVPVRHFEHLYVTGQNQVGSQLEPPKNMFYLTWSENQGSKMVRLNTSGNTGQSAC